MCVPSVGRQPNQEASESFRPSLSDEVQPVSLPSSLTEIASEPPSPCQEKQEKELTGATEAFQGRKIRNTQNAMGKRSQPDLRFDPCSDGETSNNRALTTTLGGPQETSTQVPLEQVTCVRARVCVYVIHIYKIRA